MFLTYANIFIYFFYFYSKIIILLFFAILNNMSNILFFNHLYMFDNIIKINSSNC